jgi:acetyl esterase/lipase
MLPGGPAPPDAYHSLEPAARGVAAAGAVVFAAPWRQGADVGGGYPTSFEDVACAIGVARKLAPRYGGQPDRVTLSGHSLGGWAAAVVGLSSRPFTPKPGACDATAGRLTPDALVTVSGAVQWARPGYSDDWLEDFFGGTREERPAAWRAADPFAIVDRASAKKSVPVTVIGGGADVVVPESIAKAFYARLRAAGYRARLVLVPGAEHGTIGTTSGARRAILAAAKGTSSR